MTNNPVRISVLLLAGVLAGDVAALAVTPPTALDPLGETSLGSEHSEPRSAPASKPSSPATQPASADQAMSGNPLWSIPLRQLSATRDHPLFSPSRRPPPPAPTYQPASAPPPPPPKPPEPDRPQLSLVGTVAEEAGGIGVFLDPADKSVVRLKTGENHKGWMLRSVNRRSVVLAKGFTVVEVALPAPDLSRRDAPQSGMAAQSFGIPAAGQSADAGLKGPPLPPAAVQAITPPPPVGIAGSAAGPFGAFTMPAAVRH